MNAPVQIEQPPVDTVAAEVDAPAAHRRARPRVTLGLDRFSGLYVFAALIVVFGLWIPDLFLTTSNLRSIAGDQAVTAILAFGLIIPLAAGVFDLSIAGIMGFSSVVVMWGENHGHNAALSAMVAILAGTLIGVLNGFVVVKLNVDSFIATLGMGSVLAAGAYWVTNGQQIVTGISPSFIEFGTRQWLNIPAPVYYMAALALVLWFFLEFRPAGRYLYAVGGNLNAARLAGVRVNRVIFTALVAGGTIAGFAGVILAAKLGTGNPDSGPPYLLPAFTAVFLGATQIKRGGRVNVLGTLIAIFLLASGVKGLQLAGAPVYVNDLFNGLALIIAVALAARTKRTA
jgi:ribose transport system permease protein